ncbi:MAG TPA: PKD domain-containing protein [Solirubrobacterales bacterium]|nr:PKD domain-containing protein [Solirubrobacterales bacterium]
MSGYTAAMLAARPPAARLVLAASLALLAVALLAPAALAREVYVANTEANSVSVIDTATNRVTATIPTGPFSGPYTLAISPDGRTVYAANLDGNSVIAIGTQTKSVVGAPIPVGKDPAGIAISPDGRRAYVSNGGDGSVSVVDLQARQVVGLPIPLPEGFDSEPLGVAVSPDGRRAYVADAKSESVSVIDTATNQIVGAPIEVGVRPYGIAVTPDGRRLYVANNDAESVSVVDTATLQAGGPIVVGKDPSGIAITPDGSRAYVANFGSDSVSLIDTGANVEVATILGVDEAEFVALTPDGGQGYVSEANQGSVAAFSVQGNQLLAPIPTTGGDTGQPAVVPNQPPVAAFDPVLKRIRPGVPGELTAVTSTDPDGSVATYAWEFGDRQTATVAAPVVKHVFRHPGKFQVTLTLTDAEGCSTALIYTGQTASCNGSAVAAATETVAVAYPGLRLKCPKSALPGGCTYKLRAVGVKGRDKKRIKPQSAFVRTRVRAGRTKIVSIKPRKAFAKRLGRAKRILVQETRKIAGEKRKRIHKLSVVR